MLKRSLLVIAAVVMIASSVQAGEIKIHDWPNVVIYEPQEIFQIKVIMDIGYWIHVTNQRDKVKLEQIDIHTYEGCLDLKIKSNFNADLSCKVNNDMGGWWSCSLTPSSVLAGSSTVALCVKVKNADLGAYSVGNNQQVATVSILVVPSP
jgi:hypothetical protein